MKISTLAFRGILTGAVSAQGYYGGSYDDTPEGPALPSYAGEATATSLDDAYVTRAPEDAPSYGAPPSKPTSSAAPVTQYSYDQGKQTVQVCPPNPGSSYDCTEATYDGNGKVIVVKVINISIKVDGYGQPSTITSTKTDTPSYTPIPLPGTLSTVASNAGTVVSSQPSSSIVSTTVIEYSTKPYYPIGTGISSFVSKPNTAYSTIPISTSTGTAGSSPSYPTHNVRVGQNGAEFYPPYVKAAPGDTVRFVFYPRNHTVSSCDFQAPCEWSGDYDSGYKPTWYTNSSSFVDYPVGNSTTSQWFYRFVLPSVYFWTLY